MLTEIMNSIYLVVVTYCIVSTVSGFDWSQVTAVLNNGIEDKTYPGYVALVGDANGTILYAYSNGTLFYAEDDGLVNNTGMSLSTKFDMASVTKLMSTTSGLLHLLSYNSELNISVFDTVSKYLGESFESNGKQNIRILNCLLHNAGFYPDPDPFYSTQAFGCPETKTSQPQLSFSCNDQIYANVLNQSLQYATGTEMIYSDLSFMTLSYVIGTIVRDHDLVDVPNDLLPQCRLTLNLDETTRASPNNSTIPLVCYFEAFVRINVFEKQHLKNTGFVPTYQADPIVANAYAPTQNDTSYRHAIVQGVVEDPNAFANGGIFGHAGVFSDIFDVYQWSVNLLNTSYYAIPYQFDYRYQAPHVAPRSVYDPQWTHLFLTEFQHNLSSRALGFDSNDMTSNDRGFGNLCGDGFHSGANSNDAMHTGFTGTMFCLDRERHLVYLLLTNRVWPNASDNSTKINHVRTLFSTQVLRTLDSVNLYNNKTFNFFSVPLFKQCNDSYRNMLLNTSVTSLTLCNDTLHGSLVTSLSMGFSMYDINYTPSQLNTFLQTQAAYNSNNDIVDPSVFQRLSPRIVFVGRFQNLDLHDLIFKYMFNDGNNLYVVVALMQRVLPNTMNLSSYVLLTGIHGSINTTTILVGKDPLYFQYLFNFLYDFSQPGDFWIYQVLG
ncbi:Beta-lactamase [Reticulomyxa filosa]|uniref:Beta-lactamase n=1 Tax=Reticulomyxa filosa TaxID=46433 RepID=X6LWH9_RETFI|nr:Beta-lactamase [Reticulomyxa filosa]|eukprot:ETO05964.1 Beta-lactamase [Reticulomyxa filosa]